MANLGRVLTEKVAILDRHLVDKVPVSDLCDELDINPNQFYDWSRSLSRTATSRPSPMASSKAAEESKEREFKAKLTRKNKVITSWKRSPMEKKSISGSMWKNWRKRTAQLTKG